MDSKILSELSHNITNVIKPKVDAFVDAKVDTEQLSEDKDPEEIRNVIMDALQDIGMSMMFDGTLMKATQLI